MSEWVKRVERIKKVKWIKRAEMTHWAKKAKGEVYPDV